MHPPLRETHVLRDFGGSTPANGPQGLAQPWQFAGAMAAVFALVFLPVIAAIGFFARSGSILDPRTAIAMAVFIPMAFGVFYGALRMSKQWEEQAD